MKHESIRETLACTFSLPYCLQNASRLLKHVFLLSETQTERDKTQVKRRKDVFVALKEMWPFPSQYLNYDCERNIFSLTLPSEITHHGLYIQRSLSYY
jgi:hypothetical protein